MKEQGEALGKGIKEKFDRRDCCHIKGKIADHLDARFRPSSGRKEGSRDGVSDFVGPPRAGLLGY